MPTSKSNEKRDINSLMRRLLSCVIGLVKHKVPVGVVLGMKNEIKKYGSKYILEVLNDVDKKEEIEDAVKRDVFNLIGLDPDEDIVNIEDDEETDIVSTMVHSGMSDQSNLPKKLPMRLSAMNKIDKCSWLSSEIKREQNKQHPTWDRVQYGAMDGKPSFWLPEFPWSHVTSHLSVIKVSHYNSVPTTEVPYVEFLSRLIRNCLKSYDLDPENYTRTYNETLACRKQAHMQGNHAEQRILTIQNAENVEGIENSNDSNHQTISTSDISNDRNMTFLPRRSMPDNSQMRELEHQEMPNVQSDNIQQPCSSNQPSIVFNQADPTELQSPVFTAVDTLEQNNQNNNEQYNTIQSSQLQFDSPHLYNQINDNDLQQPPLYLQHMTNGPLHEGWKQLQNAGGGPCLYRTGADHIQLNDYKILRRHVHQHITNHWSFYRDYMVADFPLTVQIGTGNSKKLEVLRNEEEYKTFISSERSL